MRSLIVALASVVLILAATPKVWAQADEEGRGPGTVRVEYSNLSDEMSVAGGGDHNGADSMQVLYTEVPDAAGGTLPIDVVDYVARDGQQVDAVANCRDRYFNQVQAPVPPYLGATADLVMSFAGDPAQGAGPVAVYIESPAGADRDYWDQVELNNPNAAGRLDDVDGLQVWGSHYLNFGGAHAQFWSETGDVGGVSVWSYLPAAAPTPALATAYIAQPVIVAAVVSLGYTCCPENVDLDALMVYDAVYVAGAVRVFEPGDAIIFSIRAAANFDGGEIMVLDWTGFGAAPVASFLGHGGHLWDTAFGVAATFGVQTEEVDAIEAVIDIEGACCYENTRSPVCRIMSAAACVSPPLTNPVFAGVGTACPTGPQAAHTENGVTISVTHFTSPPLACVNPRRDGWECTDPGPGGPIDAWVTNETGNTCQQFGVSDSLPPIPADFFGAGSEPFDGEVCLKGVPLDVGGIPIPGLPESDYQFGEADTLIRRSADPFDRCDEPSPAIEVVATEVHELNLASVGPITVAFNGETDCQANPQNCEEWDVAVGLCDNHRLVPFPPELQGSISAVKTHNNGGTYTSELKVQARFTFTRAVGDRDVLVLDTLLEGLDPISLVQGDEAHPEGNPQWAHSLGSGIYAASPFCTDFHPSMDPDDGINDCLGPPIPTVSEWGVIVLTVLVLTVGTIVFGRPRRRATA